MTLDQIIVYACVVVTVVVGAVVLRYTEVGLKVRAMVDSPAMTDLSGTSPTAISVGVWGVSTFFAGLCGVLAAPIIGLDPNQFTILIAASFAAVVAAKMRNLPVAVLVGLAHGRGHLADPALPAVQQPVDDRGHRRGALHRHRAVPHLHPRAPRECRGGRRVGGALDRAITPQGESRLAGSTSSVIEEAQLSFVGKYAGPLVLIAIVAALPMILEGYWIGLMAQAIAYAVIFISWTIVTGEGGMLWLCQITFAGVGALTTAQLANHYGWPVLAAVVIGGLLAGRHGGHCRVPQHPAG